MQVRSNDNLLQALGNIKIPDEMKEDYALVGSRLAGLFNQFNSEGKIALVNKDSDTEDKDFAFELSNKIILALRSKEGSYEAINKLLIELQKSGTLKLSPSIMDADYLKTTVTPAVYLAIQFPEVNLLSFYPSVIKNTLQEVMSALNKGRSERLSPAELFNKLFTECYSGEARDLGTLKEELINKGHRAFPLNPLFEFGPKKTTATSSNAVSITRAEVTKEKEAYAAALKQLFKPGGPLSAFPLAAIADITGSNALNALTVMIDELENHFKKGYVALLKELQGHTDKYFSSAPKQETIQNEIAPWIYLAFRYPDKIEKQWTDLKNLAEALKQARIDFGATSSLDTAISSSLGPDNLSADSSALTALLKAASKTKAGPSSEEKEEEDEEGISDEELDSMLRANGIDPSSITASTIVNPLSDDELNSPIENNNTKTLAELELELNEVAAQLDKIKLALAKEVSKDQLIQHHSQLENLNQQLQTALAIIDARKEENAGLSTRLTQQASSLKKQIIPSLQLKILSEQFKSIKKDYYTKSYQNKADIAALRDLSSQLTAIKLKLSPLQLDLDTDAQAENLELREAAAHLNRELDELNSTIIRNYLELEEPESDEEFTNKEAPDPLILKFNEISTTLYKIDSTTQNIKERLIRLKKEKYCPQDEFEKTEKNEIEALQRELSHLLSQTSTLPSEIESSYGALLLQLELLDEFEDTAGYALYQAAEQLHLEVTTIQKSMTQFLTQLPQFYAFIETIDSLDLKIQALTNQAASLKAEKEAQPLDFETRNKEALEQINREILEIQNRTKTLPDEILKHYLALNTEIPVDEIDDSDAEDLYETAKKLDAAIVAIQETIKLVASPAKSSSEEEDELAKLVAGGLPGNATPKALPELEKELSELEAKISKLNQETEEAKTQEKLGQVEEELSSVETQILIVIMSIYLKKEEDLALAAELDTQATVIQQQKVPALALKIKEKRFELIKEELALQLLDIAAIEVAFRKLSSAFGKLDDEEKNDLQKLTPFKDEILLLLKKTNTIIDWWKKFTGDKLSEPQLLEVNSKNAATEGSALTIISALTALQIRVQELMTAAALRPLPDKNLKPGGVGTLSDDGVSDDEEEEEEEEEEKNQHAGSPLTLEEIVQLTNHYRKKCYLALHSQYDCVNKKIILQTYQHLQKSTAEFCSTNKISQETFDQLLNNFLPKDSATADKERTELAKPLSAQPKEVYHFGLSCKLVKIDQIEETVKSIVVDNNFVGDPNSDKFSPPLKAKDQARVTELDFDGLKAASVERFRQETSGKHTFISESHIDKSVTDPKVLMPWACSTINRFFASAPIGTEKVKLEQGYTPEQFAALVSYCDFMGYPYLVGKKQKLRLLADSLLATREIDPSLYRRITRNLAVSMTPELEALIDKDNTDWRQWATLQQSGAYAADKWQSWLDSPGVQEKYSAVLPLGKVRHDELLMKYDANDPNLKPRVVVAQPSSQLTRNSFLSKKKVPTTKSSAKKGSAGQVDLDLDLDADDEEAPFATLYKKSGKAV